MAPERDSHSAAWNAWLLGAILVLLVAVVYWPSLGNQFIWDDETYVEDNVLLRSLNGLRHVWFTWQAVPQYYPLVHTLFWLEHHLWGLNPLGYHAVNMALQAVVVLLLWRLLLRLAVPGAWLAAAVFAVHPVCVETVAWVTEAKNLLSCAFLLGSLICYLRFRPPTAVADTADATPQREGWWYEAALLLYVAALLSKTVTSTMPAVLLVIYWWKHGRISWRDVALLVPFFILGAVLGYVTVWLERVSVGAQGAEWNFTLVERVLLAGRALWFYAGKLVWPHPLVFFYPRWTPDAAQPWQYLYPAGAVAVMVGLWLARDRIGRGPLAAVLIFAGVLFPALGFFNVYPFRFSFVADHFQYHASIALIALLAASATTLAQRWLPPLPVVEAVATAAVLVPLAMIARQQTYVYHDLITLYQHTIRLNPQSWAAHYNLGAIYEGQGRMDLAIAEFRAAINSLPKEQWHYTIGPVLRYAENTDEAAAELQRVLAESTDEGRLASAHENLASLYYELDSLDQAREHFQAALRLRPDNSRTRFNYSLLLAKQGDLPAATEQAREAVKANPNNPDARQGLAIYLLELEQPKEAVKHLSYLVELRPRTSKFRENLGRALLADGQESQAELQFQRAVELDPASPSAHALLGKALLRSGQRAAAASEFRKALRLDPGSAPAARGLKEAQGRP